MWHVGGGTGATGTAAAVAGCICGGSVCVMPACHWWTRPSITCDIAALMETRVIISHATAVICSTPGCLKWFGPWQIVQAGRKPGTCC